MKIFSVLISKMEFFKSERGADKLAFEGYTYVKQKDLANFVISYECVNRRNHHCKAKLKIRNGELLGRTNEHTHMPNQAIVDVGKARSTMKRKAETTEETSQQILGSIVETLNREALAHLPPKRTLARSTTTRILDNIKGRQFSPI